MCYNIWCGNKQCNSSIDNCVISSDRHITYSWWSMPPAVFEVGQAHSESSSHPQTRGSVIGSGQMVTTCTYVGTSDCVVAFTRAHMCCSNHNHFLGSYLVVVEAHFLLLLQDAFRQNSLIGHPLKDILQQWSLSTFHYKWEG
jgi:hypothetical protein